MVAHLPQEKVMEIPGELVKQASIIICTVDRLADLERCLVSIEPFQAAGAEVMVVNNGPHGTAVEDIAKRHDARVTTEAARGVSRARNAGIRAATGNIMAFLDDDSVADSNWLPRLLVPFRDPQVLAVVGSVGAQTLADPVSQAFDGLHRAEFPESRITLEASPKENPFPLRPALVGNANMAIRRRAFDRFGYFDVRFGRSTRIGSGEEPELLMALLRGGGKIVVEPAARIFHRHSTDWRAVRRWAFYSGCAHTAILTKYFQREPSLRGAILRYAASRLRRRSARGAPAATDAHPPRIPFLLGSLYGPIAFLLSRKK
jgi:GT2 family glycosyltransferase